jgi:large subunit ribosomal protein L9
MEVILLERVGRLGQMGDVVRVKDGFARNFLLPKGKALRATKENKTRFEAMRSDLEARSLTFKGEAGTLAAKLDGKTLVVIRQASETGQLFGSVSPRDIAAMLSSDGVAVNRTQVVLNIPIKAIGQYKVPIALHPEVEVIITINVARSADEADRLARGENITVRREQIEAEAAAEEAEKVAEALFDPEVAEKRRGRDKGDGPQTAETDGNTADTKSADAKSADTKPAKAKAKDKDKGKNKKDAAEE